MTDSLGQTRNHPSVANLETVSLHLAAAFSNLVSKKKPTATNLVTFLVLYAPCGCCSVRESSMFGLLHGSQTVTN